MRQLRVGHTPLREYHQVSGLCHRAKVFIKDESTNEASGTHKDRRCEAVLASIRPDEDAVLIHITCGNSGLSAGELTKQLAESEGKDWKDFRVKVVNIVSRNLPEVIKTRLRECSIVHEMDLNDHELTQDEMRDIAKNLTNCTDEQIRLVESYQLSGGYTDIIHEIQEDLAARGITTPPTHLVCPVGSGELVVELESAARKIWGSNAPLIIGVSIPKNAIATGKEFSRKRDRSVADKLTAPCTPYREIINDLIESGRLRLLTVTDGKILKAYRRLHELGIHCEPSAAAAFAGAFNYGFIPDNHVVIINTGDGISDKAAIEKHWLRRLTSGLKYAAVILATAALTTLAVWGAILEQTKFNTLNRNLLEAQALVYVDKDRDYWLDEDEGTSICRTIPNKNCESPLAGPFIYGFQDFTDTELGFYVATKKAESENDVVGNQTRSDMRYAYEHGRFWVRGGEIMWKHFDYTSKRWFHYDGSNIVWEESGMGDICRGKHLPPSICP